MTIQDLYQLFLKYKKVTTDSRLVEKDALFFALKGESFNGNMFAERAVENGCSYAIVDDPEFVKGDRYILVSDVLVSLQRLANYHRKQLGVNIIAITGSNGKTTTKELIAAILSKKYRISYTKGNLNNHIGVPLTLLSMNEKTEMGIVEMGANHMGEIMQLCQIAEPNDGIITNIGKAHLEGFGSFENIIKTKQELYEYIKLREGKVFYNPNNTILQKGVDTFQLDTISYGSEESAVNGELIKEEEFLALNITIGEFKSTLHSRLIGSYNLENILAAACIGNYFGVQNQDIVHAIENYAPKNNRSQFIKTKKNNVYLDAYNANPSSVELALKNFASLKKPNSWLILGDMLELGKISNLEHKKVIELIRFFNFAQVILVGSIFSSLSVPNNFLSFENVNELKKWFLENKIEHSNVLVKGSRGIQLESIVEFL